MGTERGKTEKLITFQFICYLLPAAVIGITLTTNRFIPVVFARVCVPTQVLAVLCMCVI